MGMWNISVTGHGSHHNNHDADVDKMVEEFVRQLREKGQTVETASLTYGARTELDTSFRGEPLRSPVK